MRQFPTFALFENVDEVALHDNIYCMHIFVVPLNKEQLDLVASKEMTKNECVRKWFPPGVTVDADIDGSKSPTNVIEQWHTPGENFYCENYAGAGAIFAGRGEEICENCKVRENVNIKVDITHALNRLGVSRHEIALVCFVEGEADNVDERGFLNRLCVGHGIPEPRVCGPLFAKVNENLERHEFVPGHDASENAILQRYLQSAGYYTEQPVDGHFGPRTDLAVRQFQKFNGLKVDGVAGNVTRSLMMRPRLDLHPDNSISGLGYPYGKPTCGTTVTELVVHVGSVPGYLSRIQTVNVIRSAMEQWHNALRGTLKIRVPDRVNAGSLLPHQKAISVNWSALKKPCDEGFDVVFGTVGGCLAHASEDGITLDSAEKWLLPNTTRKPNGLQFFLLPVVLHEMGHVLGLEHSKLPTDIMSPYYVSNQNQLTTNDIRRVQALYRS